MIAIFLINTVKKVDGYLNINIFHTRSVTSLKVNSGLEREPNLPILTSILSNLIYFDNGSVQYDNYERYQNY